MTYDKQIAVTILNQLGGNRFVAFTGAKDFTTIKNGLRFKIGRNASKTNRIEITLNGSDLYDMTFIKYRPFSVKVDHKKGEVKTIEEKVETIKEFKDVFFDQLQELFTEVTGLYTHF